MFHSRLLTAASMALLWLGADALAVRGQANGIPQRPVSLTQNEKDAGWRLLFDGQNTDQWREFGRPRFPARKWNVEDGCLHLLPHTRGGGDLVSVQKFNNFELTWEWRVSYGGNSGVKYLINEEHGPIGPEYQMIDDLHNEDGTGGPKHVTGSMYDVVGASNVVVKPLSEFNQSRLVIRGKHVEHWLNGRMVLAYDLESDALKAAIAASKFKTKDFYGVKAPGHILLQNHGAEVWFRNLKIRELP
jgi:3-keto-disaccharide hydrolase